MKKTLIVLIAIGALWLPGLVAARNRAGQHFTIS